jgi:ABC-type bacteriocin/lantibiotic exporter with double-glycine peptidase domain
MTRIFVAHRLNSLQQCDRIYWLEGGKIVRQGTAQEILGEYGQGMNGKGDFIDVSADAFNVVEEI